MDKTIALEWADVLESGNYSQGSRVLRTGGNDFCCLGVLCDMVKDKIGLRWSGDLIENENGIEAYGFGPMEELYNLPREVQMYVGMQSTSGQYRQDEHYITSLANDNDDGMSFKEIAQLIREKAEEL